MKHPLYSYSSYEEKWQEGMKNWEGKLPKRMTDDACEEEFWEKWLQKKDHRLLPEPYAERIFAEIAELITMEDTILEIGPGAGNYTYSLAKISKQLTVIDSSKVILDYLKKAIVERELYDVEFLHGKWEEMELDKSYDVIFGINCFYRMYEIKKALAAINQYARRLAIIGMTTSPVQPHYLKLQEQFGYEIKQPRRDYIDLLHLLYELGIFANCRMVPLTKTYEFSSYEECLKKSTAKILTSDYNMSDVENALSEFIFYHNGRYIYEHKFHAAIITWKPRG